MKQLFFLLCFAFTFGFSAIAESPPWDTGITTEINKNIQVQAQHLPAVGEVGETFFCDAKAVADFAPSPSTAAVSATLEVPKKAPALQPGNNQYSCNLGDANLNTKYYHQSKDLNPVPSATNTSNADFKVGWQSGLSE